MLSNSMVSTTSLWAMAYGKGNCLEMGAEWKSYLPPGPGGNMWQTDRAVST